MERTKIKTSEVFNNFFFFFGFDFGEEIKENAYGISRLICLLIKKKIVEAFSWRFGESRKYHLRKSKNGQKEYEFFFPSSEYI